MVWNQPSNNGQDRDPWGSNHTGNSDKNNDKNNKRKAKSAPSLLILLQKELSRLLKMSNKKRGSRKLPHSISIKSLLIPIIVVLIGGWVGSGIYSLPKGETAVVTRLGRFNSLNTSEGLNWYPKFIDQIHLVNTAKSYQITTDNIFLTSDINLVKLSIDVTYKITNASDYLFNVEAPEESLQDLLDSNTTTLVAQSTLQSLLGDNNNGLKLNLQNALATSLKAYDMGITIENVNITGISDPSQLKNSVTSFENAKSEAKKNISQSELTAQQTLEQAKLTAQKIVSDALLYKEKSTQETKAHIEYLIQLLPEYKIAPSLVKKKLYFDSMQRVLSRTDKVMLDGQGKGLTISPTNKVSSVPQSTSVIEKTTVTPTVTQGASTKASISTAATPDTSNSDNNSNSIFAQRAKNVKRLANGSKGE